MSITVVSMSRRPEKYREFVTSLEASMGSLIEEYIVFVNDDSIKERYKELKRDISKVHYLFGDAGWVFRHGHDFVYNTLAGYVKSEYILKLFDTDKVEVDLKLFQEELALRKDLYGMETYMQRGNVTEMKYQLYKYGIFKYVGSVHENLETDQKYSTFDSRALRVWHYNALDEASVHLNKTPDGFIILEQLPPGSDSFERNLLYESLAYRIVHENLNHQNRQWFLRHYTINKDAIDYYYEKAIERWKR